MALKLETTPHGVIINVKVVPNSSRDALAGLLGDALKIKVAKPPESGQANKAVAALLARTLDIAPQRITVIAGHTQPHKRLLITGLTAEQILTALLP